MLRFLAWLTVCALLLAAGVAFVASRALDEQPLVPRVDDLSASSVARARDILRQNDPRRMPRDTTREVRITGSDLEAVMNLASRRIQGKAAVHLHEGGADVRYTAPLPSPLAERLATLGLGRFLNLRARLDVGASGVAVQQVSIGRLPLPAMLLDALVEQAIRHTDLAPDIELLKKTISRVAITPTDVRLTYVWQPELLDSARQLALGKADRERLAAAQRLLTDTMDRVGRGRRAVPLAEVLGPLLRGAGGSTPAARLGQAYRDALLVAALQLSGRNVALLIPAAAHWPRPRPLVLTLGGRIDLAQHFVISAAIAAWAGEPLATAVGLDKEIDDSLGGSGFSFVDLAADRAGTRFGELVARRPERIAAAVAPGLTDAALLPSVAGLPEDMQAGEFRQRFGGPDAPAYRQMSKEIDRRIAALTLFR